MSEEIKLALLSQRLDTLEQRVEEHKETLTEQLTREIRERREETKSAIDERKKEFLVLRGLVYSIFAVLALYGWENLIK